MLAERGVEVEAVLDEGTGLVGQGVYPFIHKPVALVSTAEKGYMSMKISTTALGGTSSRLVKRSYSTHCIRLVELSLL
jgi:carboxypeptidase PM20D1